MPLTARGELAPLARIEAGGLYEAVSRLPPKTNHPVARTQLNDALRGWRWQLADEDQTCDDHQQCHRLSPTLTDFRRVFSGNVVDTRWNIPL